MLTMSFIDCMNPVCVADKLNLEMPKANAMRCQVHFSVRISFVPGWLEKS